MRKKFLFWVLVYPMVIFGQDYLQLDPSFGAGGLIEINLGCFETMVADHIVATDGKIIVAGQMQLTASSYPKAFVARFHPNGTLDTDFGSNGHIFTNLTPHSVAVNLFQDNSILLSTLDAAQKFDQNGTLDTSFGDAGTLDPEGLVRFAKVAITNDNKILTAYSYFVWTEHTKVKFKRFLSNGSPDSFNDISFGDINKGNVPDKLVIFPDNHILLSYIVDYNGVYDFGNIKLVKLDSQGIVEAEVDCGADYKGELLTVGLDGKVLVECRYLGYSEVFQYNSDLTLNTSFGTNGSSTVFPAYDYHLSRSDGKIISIDDDNGVLRVYRTNGSLLDSTFANNGMQQFNFQNKFFEDADLLGDGLLLSGHTYPYANNKLFIAKFDGASDLNINTDESFIAGLYPNPVTDFLNVTNISPGTLVSIFTMDGRGIREEQLGFTQKVDLTTLNKGFYILKIGEIGSFKIYKN